MTIINKLNDLLCDPNTFCNDVLYKEYHDTLSAARKLFGKQLSYDMEKGLWYLN